MLKSISHGISALGAFGPQADMGPLGLICHAIWILACIILYLFLAYSYNHLSFTSIGLSFCPTPKPSNPTTILRDILIFNRRLRLDVHFKDQPENQDTSPFHISSGWTPPNGKNMFLDSFISIYNHTRMHAKQRKKHLMNTGTCHARNSLRYQH
jgi:hypothetical protein